MRSNCFVTRLSIAISISNFTCEQAKKKLKRLHKTLYRIDCCFFSVFVAIYMTYYYCQLWILIYAIESHVSLCHKLHSHREQWVRRLEFLTNLQTEKKSRVESVFVLLQQFLQCYSQKLRPNLFSFDNRHGVR